MARLYNPINPGFHPRYNLVRVGGLCLYSSDFNRRGKKEVTKADLVLHGR